MEDRKKLISTQVYDAGEELGRLAGTDGEDIGHALNATLNRFLTWPFRAASGCATHPDGQRTDHFGTVIYTRSDGRPVSEPAEVPIDGLACVIDVSVSMDLEQFRAAYRKIAHAKSLRKRPVPHVDGVPHTTVTLGIIFTTQTVLPLEKLAEELDHLNQKTPSAHWPDMVVVLSKGLINYAVQFPGESPTGDYLPPAEGASSSFTPPMYIVIVMKPAGAYSFNKMCSFLLAHLAIFSPGANLPNWAEVLEGSPREALTLRGYQYNLGGELVPVPRQFYNDRYIPPRPVHIEDRQGIRLASLQFLPWQDGGVVLSTGKLPLEGLLVFLGKKALERGGIMRRGERQLSYALPITQADFGEMLNRIQRQSNMIVRTDPASFVVQKMGDEGSSSPFMARLFLGNLRLRDAVLLDRAEREVFDKKYEFVIMTLLNTRTSAKEILDMVAEHKRKVADGTIARRRGLNIEIDEEIDRKLRKEVETFLNSAVRVLKYGMQEVTKALHMDIGFLFKKQTTFEKGIVALETSDPLMALYLREARKWSESLIVSHRNAVEHGGWMLSRVQYVASSDGLRAVEPQVSGTTVGAYAMFIMDRLNCFVEEITTHCLQVNLPASYSITEVPLAQRDPEVPERFRLTVSNGGMPVWTIAYHQSTFEET